MHEKAFQLNEFDKKEEKKRKVEILCQEIYFYHFLL